MLRKLTDNLLGSNTCSNGTLITTNWALALEKYLKVSSMKHVVASGSLLWYT